MFTHRSLCFLLDSKSQRARLRWMWTKPWETPLKSRLKDPDWSRWATSPTNPPSLTSTPQVWPCKLEFELTFLLKTSLEATVFCVDQVPEWVTWPPSSKTLSVIKTPWRPSWKTRAKASSVAPTNPCSPALTPSTLHSEASPSLRAPSPSISAQVLHAITCRHYPACSFWADHCVNYSISVHRQHIF